MRQLIQILHKAVLVFFLAIVALFIGCVSSDEKKGVFDNETKDAIHVEVSDSLEPAQLVTIEKQVLRYVQDVERFDIDTISVISPTSLALAGQARKLQRKLMEVLPKFSLITGTGENKQKRNYYIIEGDVKVDKDELYYYCLKRLQKRDTSVNESRDNRKLTVATDRNGNPSIWPNGLTLKYSVMRSSFSSKALYDSAVSCMKIATSDWMKACNVRFQHLPNLDNTEIDLEAHPEQVLFIVRQLNVGGEFIAQAFFPSDPQYNRLLLLDNSFFNSSFSKTGVLRHELGHILGFRHEHIWSSDASCAGERIIEDELGAERLTKYDPFSVMHYPCGLNSNNRILELTDFDKEGAWKIYPFSK